jgi:predicted cupin superfamily sugar epimerase
MTHTDTTVAKLIQTLGLERHPEGGWYRETLRVAAPDGGRALKTAIYFLLAAGERSHWHRVDAVETWFFHAGDPLALSIHDAGCTVTHALGPDIAAGQQPQLTVPVNAWQAAAPMGAWTLVSCTVAPGFEFSGFELAPPGWEPT